VISTLDLIEEYLNNIGYHCDDDINNFSYNPISKSAYIRVPDYIGIPDLLRVRTENGQRRTFINSSDNILIYDGF